VFCDASGQVKDTSDDTDAAEQSETASAIADSIEVSPGADDSAIRDRLTRILKATGWYEKIEVKVDEGIVFLRGFAQDEQKRTWANELARNTRDVVAVVNQVLVVDTNFWDLTPAFQQFRQLGKSILRNIPLLAIVILILALTWSGTRWTLRSSGRMIEKRVNNRLLKDVFARAAAVLVFLVGLYIVLRVSGLSSLATTIIGGTGLLGLAIGFAFRDIAENFLASILISVQRPFATGDLILVGGQEGFVQRVNTRSTLIMTREGNHVQIPNATVYKQTITNFTTNPKVREDFVVGIGYDDSISQAQSLAMNILEKHSAVLNDPEPLVLVESLGAATVNLRVYFWVATDTFSQLKVRSAIIRLTKKAFDESGITMPDEAREVIFPAGVPLCPAGDQPDQQALVPMPEDDAREVNEAEGNLLSDAADLEKQARQARVPEQGENLLDDSNRT
jgi:small-conductance mechanosensitive channel